MFNLKPCPFCNGNAIWNSRVVDGKGEYSISCIKCHIKTDWCSESCVDELREQWNSRVTYKGYAKLVTENFQLKCDLDTRRILDEEKDLNSIDWRLEISHWWLNEVENSVMKMVADILTETGNCEVVTNRYPHKCLNCKHVVCVECENGNKFEVN